MAELPAYLISQGLKAPLIVTDPTVAGLDFFDKIRNDLSRQGIRPETFSGIHKNPVKSDVYKGTDVYDQTKRDAIIGIGGGAALDVARAIALRVNHREDLFTYDDLIGVDAKTGKLIPGLASSWSIEPDGTTFRVKLRDAEFHNGFGPVRAEDVKDRKSTRLNSSH